MNHLCNYGCGELGIYLNKSGKYMCSKSANSCPINKEKNSLRVKLHYQESGRNNKENIECHLEDFQKIQVKITELV